MEAVFGLAIVGRQEILVIGTQHSTLFHFGSTALIQH